MRELDTCCHAGHEWRDVSPAHSLPPEVTMVDQECARCGERRTLRLVPVPQVGITTLYEVDGEIGDPIELIKKGLAVTHCDDDGFTTDWNSKSWEEVYAALTECGISPPDDAVADAMGMLVDEIRRLRKKR